MTPGTSNLGKISDSQRPSVQEFWFVTGAQPQSFLFAIYRQICLEYAVVAHCFNSFGRMSKPTAKSDNDTHPYIEAVG
ncbi:hypothetical protein BJY04DRAFT_214586 [Aspergillus karnatakaensis]|uniref:uncharacterized protein n=1 Tax=Aspergillus karnatakaensis TaxID=1810916 RepID=UPI003CCCBE45